MKPFIYLAMAFMLFLGCGSDDNNTNTPPPSNTGFCVNPPTWIHGKWKDANFGVLTLEFAPHEMKIFNLSIAGPGPGNTLGTSGFCNWQGTSVTENISENVYEFIWISDVPGNYSRSHWKFTKIDSNTLRYYLQLTNTPGGVQPPTEMIYLRTN